MVDAQNAAQDTAGEGKDIADSAPAGPDSETTAEGALASAERQLEAIQEKLQAQRDAFADSGYECDELRKWVQDEWLPELGAVTKKLEGCVAVLDEKLGSLKPIRSPGTWFCEKRDAWHAARKKLQTNHVATSTRLKQAKGKEADLLDAAECISLTDVQDIHDIDGKGTPIYGRFKYEDWIILSWRYELHLLCHAFLMDAADPALKGVPEAHLARYFQLYLQSNYEPGGRLGASDLAAVVKLLKEPLELEEQEGRGRVLRSSMEAETTVETFVCGVEKFRRDRFRRIDAGDESAQLVFPRAAKAAPPKAPTSAGGKAPPAAAKPGAGRPAGSPGVAKPPVAQRPIGLQKPGVPLKRPAPPAAGPEAKRPRPPGPQAAGAGGGGAVAPRPAEAPAKRPPGAPPPGKAAVAKRKPGM